MIYRCLFSPLLFFFCSHFVFSSFFSTSCFLFYFVLFVFFFDSFFSAVGNMSHVTREAHCQLLFVISLLSTFRGRTNRPTIPYWKTNRIWCSRVSCRQSRHIVFLSNLERGNNNNSNKNTMLRLTLSYCGASYSVLWNKVYFASVPRRSTKKQNRCHHQAKI